MVVVGIMIMVGVMVVAIFVTLMVVIIFIMIMGLFLLMIVFVIMFLNASHDSLIKRFNLSSFLWLGSLPLLLASITVALSEKSSAQPVDLGGLKELGAEIFTKWLVPFELISILLLVALVGVIAITHKDKNAS
ncbi:MAG: hypothetical protein CSA19_02005 [Deltaproteobacteria bacterium]|nr:MAG: hypothetical protein CSA19_02005 [Deltaproteobacteria bacterium]